MGLRPIQNYNDLNDFSNSSSNLSPNLSTCFSLPPYYSKNPSPFSETFSVSLASSTVSHREFSMEKKDKVKKKKMVRKETSKETAACETQEGNTDQEGSSTPESNETSKSPEKNQEVEQPSREKGAVSKQRKDIPDGFYIAHPRNIKRTTQHFQDVHSRKLAELLEAFHMFDFDRDGAINHEDLKKTFASLNWNDVKDEEIDQMLSEGLNPLNFDAFVILLGYKTLDLDPEEVLLDALSNWDDHHEGLISYERQAHIKFLHDIMAWGDKFTEEEVGTWYVRRPGILEYAEEIRRQAVDTLGALAALADAPTLLTKTKEKMIDYIQFAEDLCGLRKMMQRKQSN